MAIGIADNFQYKGGKPLDSRLKFSTILDMTSTPAADLYDGCFAYVTGTKKYYSYDSSNTIDPTLSKWREFSAGEEYSDFTGATAQAAGVHGLVPAPTTADVDKYLKGDGSWGAIEMPNFDYSNEFGAENIHSTTEKMIGQWKDGKPLYQKTWEGVTPSSVGVNTELTDLTSWNIDKIVDMNGYYSDGPAQMAINYFFNEDNYTMTHINNSKKLTMIVAWSTHVNQPVHITFQYTKTTDSAMAIGASNDYSTTEKIVGQWIDGKPIYQKTIDCGTLPNTSDKYVDTGITNAKDVIFSSGMAYNSDHTGKIVLPRIMKDNADIMYSFTSDLSRIRIVAESNRSSVYAYITLRYTKTT